MGKLSELDLAIRCSPGGKISTNRDLKRAAYQIEKERIRWERQANESERENVIHPLTRRRAAVHGQVNNLKGEQIYRKNKGLSGPRDVLINVELRRLEAELVKLDTTIAGTRIPYPEAERREN